MMMQNLVLCTQNQVDPERPRLGQLHGHLLPLPRRCGRRLRARRGDGPPDHALRQGRHRRPRPQVRRPPLAGSSSATDSIPDLDKLPGADPHRHGERLRPRHRRRLPDRRRPRGSSPSWSRCSSRRSRCGRRARWRRPRRGPGAGRPQAEPLAGRRRFRRRRRRARRARPELGRRPTPRPPPTAPSGSPPWPPSPGPRSRAGAGGIPVRGFVRGAESAPVPQAAVTLISLGGTAAGPVGRAGRRFLRAWTRRAPARTS